VLPARVGAEVDQEGEDDDEPLEAADAVGATPHHRVGQRRPGQQEEAEEGDEPAVEGATEQVGEEPKREQRQARRDEGEEDDETGDVETLPARRPRPQLTAYNAGNCGLALLAPVHGLVRPLP
jgi:hypothetical protein